MRLSYVGELGWELYTTADLGPKLWDTLWEAGPARTAVIAAGRGAFNSLRLEKGYRSFGTDMTYEHDPYEAGLGFAVEARQGRLHRPRGAGARARQTCRRRLTCLTIDDPRPSSWARSRCTTASARVGYVTSAAYGYTIGKGIAYAWLPAELAVPGTRRCTSATSTGASPRSSPRSRCSTRRCPACAAAPSCRKRSTMSAQILDGRRTAAAIRTELAARAERTGSPQGSAAGAPEAKFARPTP